MVVQTDTRQQFKCPQCSSTFASNYNLRRHLANQHPVESPVVSKPVVCDYCQKVFKHPRSRYKHYRTCIGAPSTSEQPIESIENPSPSSPAIPVQCIVYHPYETPFKKDHIVPEECIKRMVQTIRANRIDRNIVLMFVRELYGHPENRCIRKTLLDGSYSEVYTNDLKWEIQLDKVLYPKLVADVSNQLSEFIYRFRPFVPNVWFSKMVEFLDYMAIDGYINTDNREKRVFVKNEYLLLVKEIKIAIYNMSRP